MASDTLNAADQTDVDDAFDGFEPTDSEIESLDDESDTVDTGDESLDDDAGGDGAATDEEGVEHVDDGEGAEARTDASPSGRQRDPKTGQFLKPGEKPSGKAGDKTAAAAPVEGAEQPKWEKFSVQVDKGIYPIEEAVVTRKGDHHIVAVKSTDFPRFQQRMQRGVVADRMWRQINDAVVEVEEQRALQKDAPQPKGDKEIEAETILDFLAEELTDETGRKTGQTRLSQLVEPRELTWLADRVKRRQLEYKEQFAKEHSTFVSERQKERAASAETANEGEEQLRGMARVVLDMANEASEYPQEVKDLFRSATESEIKAVYAALLPLRRSAYWREGKEWFANTQLIYNTAKQELAKVRAAATPGKPGTPANAPDPKTTRAEQLNKGSAKSTSLKTKRAPLRPSNTEHPRKPAPGSQETSHTRAQHAEDQYRKTTRNYMNSDGFDLPDDEEE